MKLSIKIYLACLIIFALSIWAAFKLPVQEWGKSIVAIPGASALLGALWQIFRDQANYEKQIKLQDRNNQFQLSTASHMAKVAFDHHVEFCEEYISKFHEVLIKLSHKGTTTEAISYSIELAEIRVKHAVWIPQEISEKLLELEDMFTKIGAKQLAAKYTPAGKNKSKLLGEAINIFNILFGSAKIDDETEKEAAITKLINIVQDILGIKELTTLRKIALENAIKITR